MRNPTSLLTPVLLAMSLAMPASAQDVPDQRTAKRELFGTRNSDMSILQHPSLSDLDLATLREMPRLASLKYYGALAIAPDAGLQADTSTGAFNYHSLQAARAAAVAGCNDKRSGGAACVVVAEVTPRRYEAGRALTLSQDASRAVDGRDFGRAGANAALAISPGTGAWGLGDGGAAAISTCAASGAGDCTVAVAK
ncbi:5-aminolevulic acid synthase [Jannaschia sp. 2305UL9-9]|uniref:5-aminolevulic acid synthase n=1 Tax=Jannaschia sp. 2305UL9-9 TaxID=3121638 RepID=UPI003529B39D